MFFVRGKCSLLRVDVLCQGYVYFVRGRYSFLGVGVLLLGVGVLF